MNDSSAGGTQSRLTCKQTPCLAAELPAWESSASDCEWPHQSLASYLPESCGFPRSARTVSSRTDFFGGFYSCFLVFCFSLVFFNLWWCVPILMNHSAEYNNGRHRALLGVFWRVFFRRGSENLIMVHTGFIWGFSGVFFFFFLFRRVSVPISMNHSAESNNSSHSNFFGVCFLQWRFVPILINHNVKGQKWL